MLKNVIEKKENKEKVREKLIKSKFLITNIKHVGESEKVKVVQSCPALCDLIDYIVHGIL